MIYYKVKKENDNKNVYYNHKWQLCLIGNELFTEKELNWHNIPEKYCDKINVNKNNTYWSFGARFEKGEN